MRNLILLAVPVALSGCNATHPDAPSLLPRPIESRSDAEPTVVAAEIPADAALDREIAARAAAFDSALKTFDSAAARAQAHAGRTARPAVGSDAWLDAQAVIGELDQALSASEAALADLEGLAIARASDGRPPYPALDAAIAAAQGRSDTANATSVRLKDALAS